MIKLEKSLQAWGTAEFQDIFKLEVMQLDHALLPLQESLTTCNYVSDTPVTVMIHSVTETDKLIQVKAGIFYQGIIGGCSCADDPTPINDINEYCEVQVDIDKHSALAEVMTV